jgi:hypothetical protein
MTLESPAGPAADDLQSHCELGQEALMRMDYLEAERLLAAAERVAWDARDFDTLSRLYMPLQEARRQRRQRCGEGIVRLDLVAQSPNDHIRGREVLENYPFGQLLVAGWASIEPALEVRRLQHELGLYVETFLAAVYPTTDRGLAVIVAPLADTALPRAAEPRSFADLQRCLPERCLLFGGSDLPTGDRRGTPQTYAETMSLWERLHTPFLVEADAEIDPMRRIEGYRRTIEVDYAAELPHQKLSDTARSLLRHP